MEPYYFDCPTGTLFAIYDPPVTQVSKHTGLIICAAFGREHIRSQRAVAHLARSLAGRGYHVLRFDFSGCGDSSGDLADARIRNWVADTHAVIEEIKGGIGAQKAAIIGIRLGAAVAVLAAAQRTDVASLLLWQPVSSGQQYIEEMRNIHAAWQNGSFSRGVSSSYAFEYMGFALPDALLRDLQTVDLLGSLQPRGPRLLIADAAPLPLFERLSSMGCNVDLRQTCDEAFWQDSQEKGIVPARDINMLVEWICGELECNPEKVT